MMDQTNLEDNCALVNENMKSTATWIRDITMMNPSEFHKSKVYEDPQELIF